MATLLSLPRRPPIHFCTSQVPWPLTATRRPKPRNSVSHRNADLPVRRDAVRSVSITRSVILALAISGDAAPIRPSPPHRG